MISAVLFDADGVVQTYGSVAEQCVTLGWEEVDYPEFLAEVFGHELWTGCLEGRTSSLPALRAVLTSRGHPTPPEQFLADWHRVGTLPDPTAFELVARLRSGGLTCCLATNQDRERAQYMDEVLGYRDLFDHSFYSCRLGVAKPDPGYFAAALAVLERPGPEVLFLDDHEPNVVAARGAGLEAEVVAPGSDLAELLERHGVFTASWGASPRENDIGRTTRPGSQDARMGRG